MTNRREFLRLISFVSVCPRPLAQAMVQAAASVEETPQAPGRAGFPVTMQLSPLPGQPPWKDLAAQVNAGTVLKETVDSYIQHGFTGLQYPFHLTPEMDQYLIDYARSRGLFLTYNYTFAKGGVEVFGRNAPPDVSVYAPEYAEKIKQNLVPVLSQAQHLPGLYNLFCYQDEPFHARAESFDYSPEAKAKFRSLFGYDMRSAEAAHDHPKQWLDLLNFQSDTFPAGWRQVYKLVKQAQPKVKVILTHDSHSALGAGVGSNETIAVDDVFHWGADFADTIVFDIYPYMMFDFRYGEFGKFRKPRLSQMHFALAQLRNVVYAYGKELGFWFGTYNKEWFKDFMGPELAAESWAEAETCHTAVAHGANFLISGYKVPEDRAHWDTLGNNLATLHRAMPDLLACPKVKAKGCFIFPRTQYLQLQQEYWNVAVAYELFRQSFGELDCLHEEQVANSGLDGYEIVVLFDVQLLPAPVAHRIIDFVNAGGVVIADCVPALDEYRKPMAWLKELFGVRASDANRIPRSGVFVPKLEKPKWFVQPATGQDEDIYQGQIVRGQAFAKEWYFRAISPRDAKVVNGEVLLATDSGVPAVIHRQSGKGHAYLLGFCVQDTYFAALKDSDVASSLALHDLIWVIAQHGNVVPRVRSSNPQIEASMRASATAAFVFVINHEADRPDTQVSVANPGFDVVRIQSLAQEKAIHFRNAGRRIVFDLEVPRDKPEVLRLEGRTGG